MADRGADGGIAFPERDVAALARGLIDLRDLPDARRG